MVLRPVRHPSISANNHLSPDLSIRDTSTVQIYRKMSIHEFVQYDHTYNFTKQAQSQKKNTISKQQVKRPSLQNHLFVVRMK